MTLKRVVYINNNERIENRHHKYWDIAGKCIHPCCKLRSLISVKGRWLSAVIIITPFTHKFNVPTTSGTAKYLCQSTTKFITQIKDKWSHHLSQHLLIQNIEYLYWMSVIISKESSMLFSYQGIWFWTLLNHRIEEQLLVLDAGKI